MCRESPKHEFIFPLTQDVDQLQSNQWSYEQHFMDISLHTAKAPCTGCKGAFINYGLGGGGKYFAYLRSYTDFILFIFPLILLYLPLTYSLEENNIPTLRGL